MDSKIYALRREQWIQRPVNEVFAFFADAHNLEEITPSFLRDSDHLDEFHWRFKRDRIRYRLRLHGIPIHWRTEILDWNPPYSFVDVQRSGPYKLWHHTHKFEAHGDQTRMTDVVQYSLPFGWLGQIAHALKVDTRRETPPKPYPRIREISTQY